MAKNKMRAGYGQVLIKHKGKLIPTSVGSRSYENIFNKKASSLTEGSIPADYAHRPDLIANLFLNTPGAWWLVCEQNSIFDVFEQLNAGDRIKLPNPL